MKTGWHFVQGDEIIPGRVALNRLGGGHRYEAYLAWDEVLFSAVVVKIIRPDQVNDSSALRGLDREVRTLERLCHPVLVRTFGAVLGGPRPHVVLEHLDGPRLSTLLRKYGRLPLEQLLPLALEVCSALHYLGESGTAHLDVKPSNIIMGAPPRLIDLSIARTFEEAAALDHPVGTDAYMAPEQCDPPGTGTPGPEADVWGIGATLFEATAGYRPFREGTEDEQAPVDERWPQVVEEPRALPRDVPDGVAKPVLACLHKDPAQRPTASELARLLEPLVGALPKPTLGRFKPRLA
jgi:eukaryotic-like serine/threonine-protein kinase